jgi:cyclopropane-fatty-acyl-phospholipid synthase
MMSVLAAVLRRIVKTGQLSLIDSAGRRVDIGEQNGGRPALAIRLHDRRVPLEVVCNPQLTLGEAYMDGRLSVEGGTIADVLDLLMRNIGTGFGGGYIDWIAKLRSLKRRLLQRNGRARSVQNVAHH